MNSRGLRRGPLQEAAIFGRKYAFAWQQKCAQRGAEDVASTYKLWHGGLASELSHPNLMPGQPGPVGKLGLAGVEAAPRPSLSCGTRLQWQRALERASQ